MVYSPAMVSRDCREVCAEWYGMSSSATAAQNTAALQAALDTGRNVRLPRSADPFLIGDTVYYYSRQRIQGAGWNIIDDDGGTILRATQANVVLAPHEYLTSDETYGAHLMDFGVDLDLVGIGGISMEGCYDCQCSRVSVDQIPDTTWLNEEAVAFGAFGFMIRGRRIPFLLAPGNVLDHCWARGGGATFVNNVGFLIAGSQRGTVGVLIGTSSNNRIYSPKAKHLGRGLDVACGGSQVVVTPDFNNNYIGIYFSSSTALVLNPYVENCEYGIYDDHDRSESGSRGDNVIVGKGSFSGCTYENGGPSGYSVKFVDPERSNPAHGRYDFAIDGGVVGNHVLGTIPLDAVIVRAWYEVETPFTSGGAAQVRIGINTDDPDAIVALADYDDAVYSAGWHDGIPNGTAATFSAKPTERYRTVVLAISGAALTAGRIHVVWEISPP